MAKASAVKRPSRPTIDTVTDNVGPHTGEIGQAGLTNDPRPVLSGHGDVGSIIHIRVDNQEVGTIEVGPDGTWTCQLAQPLSDGLFRLSVRASNEGGTSAPSEGYMIEVDVTPPSSPIIDRVSSGEPAMLSGHAEPYSTVNVYDGDTLLGTATTGADSQWTFSLPAGMSVGTHALTATAMDPAGNTGKASAGFDYVVEPLVPTARAVVDDAGRDSGLSSTDWLTNDGSAGRLISGRVEGVLGARDRVQISTDGGRTWQDALMKTDGTWVAIDPNVHVGNWTIQSRVINDAGRSGDHEWTDVTFKDSMAMPIDVTFDLGAGTMTVKFDSKQVALGSKVMLDVDGEMHEFVLSAKAIADGQLKLTDIPASSKSLTAALVDVAGNISSYRGVEYTEVDGPTVSEDFEDRKYWYTNYLYKTGQVINTDNFDLACIQYDMKNLWLQGLLSGAEAGPGGANAVEFPPTRALVVTNQVRLTLHEGVSARSMSFELGDMTEQEVLMLNFYDKNGNMLKTVSYSAAGGLHQSVNIDVGAEFSYIDLIQDWQDPAKTMSWLDNIVFRGGKTTELTPIIQAPDAHQTLIGDIAYYGGNDATLFTVADAAYFSGASAGAHGGAGIDTLKLTGASQILDVMTLNSGTTDKLSGIEVIDITGSGNNMLRMSIADALNLGHQDAFRQDGYSQMEVKGNAGDRVILAGMGGFTGGDWASEGNATIDDTQYAVYRNDALKAELFVQTGVTVSLESPATRGLSIADVLDAGRQDVFGADDAAQSGGSASAANAGQAVLESAGYTASHNAALDIDQLMQSASQSAVVH